MKILVTGAHGLVGRSLLRQRGAAELVGCGRSSDPAEGRAYQQVDLLDREALRQLLVEVQPDWVIHTAALTNVDQCETERERARQVNLDTVSHLVETCGEVRAGLVHFSTDYVFDGRRGPYDEEDQPNPLSYYGALKLESERLVLDSGIKGLVVRTLWLYGYILGARPNLVTWPLDVLARGEPVQIVDDQWGNPTYVHDLAQGVLELCQRDFRGLLHLGGAAYMTRYELVLQLARFFGLRQDLVKAVSTAALAQQALRPLRSGLQTAALSSQLGRAPLSFKEGLEQMAEEDDFRRDFAHVV
jgi:dTDP-4-dehydrorhamnose reductase